ncbi:hypothetical protein [Aeoliella sp. SH292]|uniref:hypothetical protein n=1 Tax=Aeoliella sp. SH292 TaxID=3454464 RepID=UPI003F97FA7E
MSPRKLATFTIAIAMLLAANVFAADPADRKAPRIICDNDGNEAMRGFDEPLVESHLRRRTTDLVGTHVDSIYYCTNGGFGTCSRQSKVWKPLVDCPKEYPNNRLQDLFDLGTDPLAITVKFCKENDLEVFESVRMNDVHDHSTKHAMGVWRFEQNDFKHQHPECLMETKFKKPVTGAWSAVDYSQPVVRDSVLAYLTEGCTNYDIDGVHLDFFRHPVFFRSTYEGKKATAEELAQMTDLVTKVRAMTKRIGDERGRPLLVSIRVPDSVEYCRAIGLDLEAWLAAGLVDRLVTSSYFQLNEWDYTAKLAKRYGVLAYPSLDESRVKDPDDPAVAQAMRGTLPVFRARALEAWASGMDGVLMFNGPEPTAPHWRELGDPAKLAELDRDYFASFRGAHRANGGNLPYAEWQKIETLNPANPREFRGSDTQRATLHIAEKLPKNARLTLAFQVRGLKESDVPLRFALNDKELRPGKVEKDWYQFEVSADDFRQGANELEVTLADRQPKAKWMDAKLEVRVE